jgi:hypothetical protein
LAEQEDQKVTQRLQDAKKEVGELKKKVLSID